MTEETCHVEKVEVEHNGDFHDGFPTHVVVDGKTLPQLYPDDEFKWDKKITIRAVSHKALVIDVETGGGNLLRFVPRQFAMTMFDVHVEIHPERYPCKVVIGGHEVHCTDFKIVFEEGVMPRFNVSIVPWPMNETILED